MRYDDALTDELGRRQVAVHATDRSFADTLGIDRETWRRLRTGKQTFTLRILRNVVQVFPELEEAAKLLVVPENANQCDSDGE